MIIEDDDEESPVRRDIAKDALLLKAVEDATECAAGETVKFLSGFPCWMWNTHAYVNHSCESHTNNIILLCLRPNPNLWEASPEVLHYHPK